MASEAVLKAKISLNDSLFTSGMKKVASTASSVGKNIGRQMAGFITSPLGATATAISAFFTYSMFKKGISGAIEAGAALEKMHKQTGIGVGTLSMLSEQFKMADVDADILAGSVNKMQRNLVQAAKGGGQVGQTLLMLGLNIRDIEKMSPENQFSAIGSAIAKMQNPALKTAAAMAVFGKSGAQLLPVFDNLKNVDLGDLNEKAKLLEDNAESFYATSISLKLAGASFSKMFIGMAATMAPAIKAAADAILGVNWTGIGKQIGKKLSFAITFLQDIGYLFSGISAYIQEVGDGAMIIGMKAINAIQQGMVAAVQVFAGIISDPMEALPGVGAALIAAFSAAGNLLFAAIKYPLVWMGNFFKALGKDSIPVFGSKLFNALGLAASNFHEILINAGLDFLTTMSAIPGLFDAANAGITALMNTKTGVLVAKAKYQGGLAADTKKIDRAADTANKETKFENKDILGAKYWEDQAKGYASSVIEAGKKATNLADFKPPFDEAQIKKIIESGCSNAKVADKFFDKFKASVGKAWEEASAEATDKPAAKKTSPDWMKGINMNAYDQTPLLSVGERNKFENQRVAAGGMREASTPFAYGAVRSGDAYRRKAYERQQERVRLGQETSAEGINTIVGQLNQLMNN